jgi:putative intracellular protease/amidase
MSSKLTLLFVLTNHSELGTTGKKTGVWISELAHPYEYLKEFYNIVFASPKGGYIPIDPGSLEAHKDDKVVVEFLANAPVQDLLKSTKTLAEVADIPFDAIVYPGGHGPMYDLAHDSQSHAICRKAFEKGRPVAALCHGPAAIVNVKLSDGSFMVKGKRVTGFANSEEDAVGLTPFMPFLLETQFVENGGLYEKAENWACKVVVDGNLITGQNPASAHELAVQLHKLLQ